MDARVGGVRGRLPQRAEAPALPQVQEGPPVDVAMPSVVTRLLVEGAHRHAGVGNAYVVATVLYSERALRERMEIEEAPTQAAPPGRSS